MRWNQQSPQLSRTHTAAIGTFPPSNAAFGPGPISRFVRALVPTVCIAATMHQATAASMQYATGVVSYAPGPYVEPPYNNASRALHAPDNGHVSLGNQGSLTVRFATPIASDGNTSAGDVLVYEGGGVSESVAVYVSEDGGTWMHLGDGRGLFDIDRFGPDRNYQFVRVVDLLPNTTGRPYAGADIDAIGFISAPEDECTAEGNPCNPLTGEKHEIEHDLASIRAGGLSFTRYYSSSRNRSSGGKIGRSWRHSYARSLYSHVSSSSWKAVIGANGRYQTFVPNGSGGWTSPYSKEVSLTYANSRWTHTDADGNKEIYDSAGKLLSIQSLNGVIQTLTYTLTTDQGGDGNSATLDRVMDSSGHSLLIAYGANGQISSVTTPLGTIGYRYDANNNLEYIDRPDGFIRQYHYEDPNHPSHLTGITDERGVRYATWSYDAEGRVESSEHAGGTERVALAYNPDGTTTVTTGTGATRVYQPIAVKGVRRVGGITGDPCTNCINAQMKDRTYDTEGYLSSYTDWADITTQFGDYDAKGQYGYRVEAAGTPEQRRTDYTYDARFHNKITSIVEPSVAPGQAKVTTTTYDNWGNRLSETVSGFRPDGMPVSRTTTWAYDGPLHQLSQVDGPRSDIADITTYEYYPDDPGQGPNRARLRRVVDATGTAVRDDIQYTVTGKVLSESRPNGVSLSYGYYPGNDRLETLIESAAGASRVTRWTYLPTGEVASITQGHGTPEATTLSFGYDDARRLTRLTDGLGNYISYQLDTEGNREYERIYDSTNALRKQLQQTFDLYNRLDTTAQANESTNPDYTTDGTLDRSTDGKGAVTDYSYDTLKRLTHVVQDQNGSDPATANAITGYGYDAADRLTTVTDPVNGTTTYVYDDLGNLLAQASPDTGTTTFTHDAGGNVLTKTDAKGQTFSYGYDALNRLIFIDGPAELDYAYAYDDCAQGRGRLCSITGPTATVAYRYTAFGEIAGIDQTAQTWSGYQTAVVALDYSYDAVGRVSTLTYPSGAVVRYHYNAAGQTARVELEPAGFAPTTLIQVNQHHPFGPILHGQFGNGTYIFEWLDTAYRPNWRYSGPYQQWINPYNAYDGNGNLLMFTGTERPIFNYDALDRLANATAPTFDSRGYEYDRNGNRTRLIADGLSTGYDYSPQSNRLISLDGQSVILDANGNTTALRGMTLSYNAHNRLTAVAGRGEYRYNGLGQRVIKTRLVPGAAGQGRRQTFAYGLNGELLIETGPTGQVTREYIYLDGQPLAMLDQRPSSDEDFLRADFDGDGVITGEDFYEWYFLHFNPTPDPAYEVTGDGVNDWNDFSHVAGCAFSGQNCRASQYETRLYYAHNDHLGTPKALTDESGTAVWRATHAPFGLATVDADPDGDGIAVEFNVRFPGQYYDGETGLHYNYYRYYDSEVGRYLTADPRGLLLDFSDPARQVAATMGVRIPRRNKLGYLNHSYGYVDNNPVNRADPTGEIDPVTAGLIIWGLLYINNAGDAVSDPNGNVWGEPQDQDNVCTLPFPIGPIANECVLDRCQQHDACFDENGCTASSWVSSILGGTKSCNQCNSGFFK